MFPWDLAGNNFAAGTNSGNVQTVEMKIELQKDVNISGKQLNGLLRLKVNQPVRIASIWVEFRG
jgi:hypothetical protein